VSEGGTRGRSAASAARSSSCGIPGFWEKLAFSALTGAIPRPSFQVNHRRRRPPARTYLPFAVPPQPPRNGGAKESRP